MGRPSYSGGGSGSSDRPRPRRDYRQSYSRRKVCQFCVDKISYIDYKDVNRLRRYLNERARIEPRRSTGTCAKHQRRLSVAIKRARSIALLPFTPEQLKTLGFSRPEGFRGRSEGGYRGRRPDGGGGYGDSRRPPAAPREAAPTPAPSEVPPSEPAPEPPAAESPSEGTAAAESPADE